MLTAATIDTQLHPQNVQTQAPIHSYWVYTEKGSRLHQTRPGAVVKNDPYFVPSFWISEGLVTLEELE